MKRFFIFTANRNFRNAVIVATLTSCLLGASTGCALFGKKTDKEAAKISEFEEDSEENAKNEDSESTVFDSEREKQSDLSNFVSSFGRKSKDKKAVDPGQTFLMSDKAKEIYANTER